MRTFVIAGCVALVLSGCRSEETAQPTEMEISETTDTAGTMMSDTITPGTTERAATGTSTVAPTPVTRTTTSAPPGTTVRQPAGGASTAAPPPADAAPAPTAVIAEGRRVFQPRCAGCHGAAGQKAIGGGRVLRGSAIQKMAHAEIERRIRNNQAHGSIKLSQTELHAVAAYVKALD